MANPISCTPTLKGKEAELFHKKALENRNRVAPKKDVMRAVRIYKAIMKNSNLRDL
jgi:hypothetical protein